MLGLDKQFNQKSPRETGGFSVCENYQRIGDRFCAIKISLQRENGFEPKKPRYADSGLG